jgi:hypothetical protein
MKKRPTQVKKDQLDNGMLVSLNKDNWKRYKRAKSQKTGFRITADDNMLTAGSGFADILKGIKSGAQKVASVAVPYVKNLAKSLLPKVRSDIDANLNTGVNFVSDKLRSGLSPILGQDITNELVDKGAASVKGFAKDKLDQAQGYLQGLVNKIGQHYKMHGGKLSFNFGKIADILKPIAKVAAKMAAPALASSVGGPAAGVAASMVADSLLGEGAPPRLYLGRPGALPHEKEQLKGKGMKILAVPKRAARGRKKKINGAALLPMGRGHGGALFPM